MKLEDQVISLELAKKLKRLGVKQESIWHWKEFKNQRVSLRHAKRFLPSVSTKDNYYSAFTVAELGKMLPYGDELFGKRLEFMKRGGIWKLHFQDDEIDNLYYEVEDKLEVNARVKMLIYFLESKLI